MSVKTPKEFNKEFNPGQLDFNLDEQDRIISQLIFDKEFLQKSIRKGVKPELFTSETRRILVEYIFEYWSKYKEAPIEAVIDITSNNGFSIKLKDDDIKSMYDYLEIVTSISSSPGKIKYLFDKLTLFIDKRIIHNSITKLQKMKDCVDGSPESLSRIIHDASEKLSIRSSMDSVESLFDVDNDLLIDPQWLTRFNLPPIDSTYGGGLTSPNFIVLQGFTGRGKTWCIGHLAKIALRLGNDPICIITEMSNKKFKQRMQMAITGLTAVELRSKMGIAREIMSKSMIKGSDLKLISEAVKLDIGFTIDKIESIVKDIEDQTSKEQKLILIDSPDDMEPPPGRLITKTMDKSTAIFTWLRNYTQEKDKCVIVTCQSQRISEKLLWTTSGNIGDDLNKVRRATLGISINGFKKEVDGGYIRLLVFKNTYGPTMKACWVKTNFKYGQFIDSWGELKGLSIKKYKQMLLNQGIKMSNSNSDDG